MDRWSWSDISRWFRLTIPGMFFAALVAFVLRIEVCDLYTLEFLLQISQSLIVRFRQRVRNGVESVLSIVTRLPIDWTKDTVSGDSLESFEKAKCFQHASANREIVECNLGMISHMHVLLEEEFGEGDKVPTLTCCTIPWPSIINIPLKLTPSSSIKTP